jgi:hypothetical protein
MGRGSEPRFHFDPDDARRIQRPGSSIAACSAFDSLHDSLELRLVDCRVRWLSRQLSTQDKAAILAAASSLSTTQLPSHSATYAIP